MIVSFRHKGLERLWSKGNAKSVPADLLARIERRLAVLDAARTIDDLNLPEFRLHQWQGRNRGIWSIDVNGPWRMLFRFEDGDAYDVDLDQPH